MDYDMDSRDLADMAAVPHQRTRDGFDILGWFEDRHTGEMVVRLDGDEYIYIDTPVAPRDLWLWEPEDSVPVTDPEPKSLFRIDDAQRKLFGELLWNALGETPAGDWSDYDAVVLTYVQVAPVWMLEASRDNLPDAVQERIDAELKARSV